MKATGGFFTNREAQEALIGKFSARTQANARAVVNYLVTHARWKDDAGGLKLKRGELVIGREKTSAAIGVSVDTFRNVLQRLREVGFMTTSPAKERAKKVPTRNRKKSPPGIRGRATEGTIVTIREYDTYCELGQSHDLPESKKSPPGILKSPHSSKKYKLKDLKDLKDLKRHVPLSEGLDAPAPADGHGKNGKAKTPPQIADYFRATINPRARLTAKAQRRIEARLRAYSVPDLCMAIDGWACDRWQMENNGHRGMAWFFETDDRIDQHIGQWEVRKKPAASTVALSPDPRHEQAHSPARPVQPVAPEPVRCGCPNCNCEAEPASDNAVCGNCQSGACWKEPTTESPQQPTGSPYRDDREDRGFTHPQRLSLAVEFDKALKKRREAA